MRKRRRVSKVSLPRASSRLGVLRLEKTRIVQWDLQVVGLQEDRKIVIPVASISALLLGYGTSITHDASLMLYNAGVVVLWYSGHGVQGYAPALPVGQRADLFQKHVSCWSNDDMRLSAAKRAYRIRFDDDLSRVSSLDKVRQLEGNRAKEKYREVAKKYGVVWRKRVVEWEEADELNKCITVAYQYLYGYAFAAISLTGCSPALGFIHTGHRLAFVYDVADVLKTSIGLEVAFEAYISGGHELVGGIMNKKMHREKGSSLLVNAIYTILGEKATEVEELPASLELWDGPNSTVPANTDYSSSGDG